MKGFLFVTLSLQWLQHCPPIVGVLSLHSGVHPLNQCSKNCFYVQESLTRDEVLKGRKAKSEDFILTTYGKYREHKY